MRARAPFCAFLRASSPSVPSTTIASSGESSVLRVTVLIALLRKMWLECAGSCRASHEPDKPACNRRRPVQHLRRAAGQTATDTTLKLVWLDMTHSGQPIPAARLL